MYNIYEKEFIRLNWQKMTRVDIANHLKKDKHNLSSWMHKKGYISNEMKSKAKSIGANNRIFSNKEFIMPDLNQKQLYLLLEKFTSTLKPGGQLHDIAIITLSDIEKEEKRFSILFS